MAAAEADASTAPPPDPFAFAGGGPKPLDRNREEVVSLEEDRELRGWMEKRRAEFYRQEAEQETERGAREKAEAAEGAQAAEAAALEGFRELGARLGGLPPRGEAGQVDARRLVEELDELKGEYEAKLAGLARARRQGAEILGALERLGRLGPGGAAAAQRGGSEAEKEFAQLGRRLGFLSDEAAGRRAAAGEGLGAIEAELRAIVASFEEAVGGLARAQAAGAELLAAARIEAPGRR